MRGENKLRKSSTLLWFWTCYPCYLSYVAGTLCIYQWMDNLISSPPNLIIDRKLLFLSKKMLIFVLFQTSYIGVLTILEKIVWLLWIQSFFPSCPRVSLAYVSLALAQIVPIGWSCSNCAYWMEFPFWISHPISMWTWLQLHNGWLIKSIASTKALYPWWNINNHDVLILPSLSYYFNQKMDQVKLENFIVSSWWLHLQVMILDFFFFCVHLEQSCTFPSYQNDNFFFFCIVLCLSIIPTYPYTQTSSTIGQ